MSASVRSRNYVEKSVCVSVTEVKSAVRNTKLALGVCTNTGRVNGWKGERPVCPHSCSTPWHKEAEGRWAGMGLQRAPQTWDSSGRALGNARTPTL